jgi:thiamine-phosphate pyrophosphorylase
VARAAAAVRGGATMVQLRLEDVDARELIDIARALVEAVPVPVVVNDRADVALAAGAAGAHVGIDGVPASALRRVVPAGFIIGASAGAESDLAGAREADYVGIGPVFAASARPGVTGGVIGIAEFSRLARLADMPVVAIGGIDATNHRQIREAGAHGVAVIRAIFSAPDPERAARELSSASGR